MKIIFRIQILSLLLFNGMVLHAQTNTSYPYSMYGIGDIKPTGFAQNRAFGGAGIALSSNSTLNNVNPASYNSIDSLSFILETGMDMRRSKYASQTQKQTNTNMNFGYLAIGFRLTPWWANSFGAAPYSGVGNEVNTTRVTQGSLDNYYVSNQGSGGVNQFYWGNSFKPFKRFFIGVNMSYLLGNIKQTQSLTSNYFNGSLVTQDQQTIRKICFNYGVQYSFNIMPKLTTTIGGIFGNKNTVQLNTQTTILDNSNDTLENTTVNQGSITLPQYYGVGISFKLADKLMFTSDYKFYQWSQTKSIRPEVQFVNSTNYCAGIELLPSTSFRSSYIAKIKYRLGGYYNNTYLKIQGQQIRDAGLSAGLSAPLFNRLTVNLSYNIGRRGAVKKSGLITENYQSFLFDITLFDFWFIKPKFN
jgi:hypothetical protein